MITVRWPRIRLHYTPTTFEPKRKIARHLTGKNPAMKYSARTAHSLYKQSTASCMSPPNSIVITDFSRLTTPLAETTRPQPNNKSSKPSGALSRTLQAVETKVVGPTLRRAVHEVSALQPHSHCERPSAPQSHCPRQPPDARAPEWT